FAVNGYNPNKTEPPKITSFTVEPASVNEGEPVSLTLEGSGIDSCTGLGNGEELSLALSLTEASSHTPTHDTDYEISCVGRGGSVTAKASVNIILADDVIKTDLLSEIAKTFDAQAIKNLALEGLEGAELKDFDGEYKGETVSLSENYPDSISMSDAAV